jgi:hypothetical protein
LSLPVNIPAAAQFGLSHPPHKPETGSPSPATATVISHDLGDVFREEKVAGKARRQHTAHLNDSLFPLWNLLERQWIPYEDVCKCRDMLVALRAIRVYNTYVLHHAVEIDNPVSGTPEHAGQAVIERLLIYCFLL